MLVVLQMTTFNSLGNYLRAEASSVSGGFEWRVEVISKKRCYVLKRRWFHTVTEKLGMR